MPSFNTGSSEEGGGRGEGETLEEDAEGVRHKTCEGPVERNLSRAREEPREGERESACAGGGEVGGVDGAEEEDQRRDQENIGQW